MYFFLVLLHKASVPLLDIVNFYCTCVRPLLNTVRPCSTMAYLAISARISREFKSGRLILSLQGHSYCDNLARFGLKTLQSRRESICLKLFQSISSDECFGNLAPPRHKASHKTRHSRTFTVPRFRTDRYNYKRSYTSNEQIY